MDRFSRQYQEAQYLLDGMVMDSMIEFMPMISGDFIDRQESKVHQCKGLDLYVRRQNHMDVFFILERPWSTATGSTWARRDAEKVLVSQYSGKTNAKENLQYTKSPHTQVQAEWFDAAKRQYGSTWLRKVKAQAGGGRHGR